MPNMIFGISLSGWERSVIIGLDVAQAVNSKYKVPMAELVASD